MVEKKTENTSEGRSPYEIITSMNDQRLSVFLTFIVDMARNNTDADEIEIFVTALEISKGYEQYFSEEDQEEVL